MSQLSISLVPGYLPADDELITPAILRAIARPNVLLDGTFGSSSLADGAVTTAKLADGALSADTLGRNKMADGYVTAAKLATTQDWTGLTLAGAPAIQWSGLCVQQAHASTANLSTLTSAGVGTGDLLAATSGDFNWNDVVPIKTDGAQLLSVAITPQQTTNILEVEAIIPCSFDGGSNARVYAVLFQDSTTNALAGTFATTSNDTFVEPLMLHLRHRMVANTVQSTTFKIRVGVSASSMTINGSQTLRKWGGILAARLFVKEYVA